MEFLLSIIGLFVAWFVISNFALQSKLNSKVDFLEKEITSIKPYINKEKELKDFLIKTNRTVWDSKLFGIQWTNPEMSNFVFSHEVNSSNLNAIGHDSTFITFFMSADYTDNGIIINCSTRATDFHAVSKEAKILATRLNFRGKLLKSVI